MYEADKKLGQSVKNQRNQLKKYKDDEPCAGTKRERIVKLKSIGFEWGR
jgi:hypothetical protein